MQISNSLTVQRVPIDAVGPSDAPFRRHPATELNKIRKSFEKFGVVNPLLVTRNGTIVDGEARWQVLKESGASYIEVIVIADRSSAELKTLRLALNRIGEDAKWDSSNIRIALEDIAAERIDLDFTGFDTPEIDHYLNLDLLQANVEENGSDIPPVDVRAVSSPGAIWRLGNHSVGCGSATDLAFVSRVLDGRAASVCFVDPPYNIKVDGFITGKGRHRHREFVQGAGEMSTDEYFGLLRDSFLVLKESCSPRALMYACIDWRHVMEMTVAGRACDMPLYTICVWTKTNGGMGGIYRNAHELVCVFRAGTEAPLDNVELGRHGRNRTNVWSYPGMSSFGKEHDKLLGSHPTVKPVTMIADVLRDVTKRGDIVLDTFLGSGSTLMAAQETGRICCGVELDPLYVDVAIRRWQNATGREAVLTETGEPFNDVAQRLLAAPSESNDGA
jgi:DNA modification methylase